MRRYLFTTGLFSAVLSGLTLMRSLREQQFTWRAALAILSWGITLALAIGSAVDTRRAETGHAVADDSPIAPKADKLRKKHDRGRLPVSE